MDRRDLLSGAGLLTLGAAASRWAMPILSAEKTLSIAAVGDCLITRGFLRDDPGLQPLLSILRGADVTFGNFEMTLPDPGMYPAATGACGDLNNSVEGPMPEELRWAGFNLMSTANNHALDYGADGMFATSRKLGAAGIAYTGTGRNLQEARAPVFYDSPAGRVALIACASTIRSWSAATEGNGEIPGRPGLNPLRYHTRYRVDAARVETLRQLERELFPGGHGALVEPAKSEGFKFLGNEFIAGSPADVMTFPDARDLQGIVASVRRARRNADLVLVSIHAHEAHRERESPADFLRQFAHACIDAGASVFVGHGPHVLRGIEIYNRRPIFYSLGNFIFEAEGMRQIPQEIYDTCGIAGDDPSDFFDQAMRGFADTDYWESVIAQATFQHGELSEVWLYPVDLQRELTRAERGMPTRANRTQSMAILDRLARLSQAFGTKVVQDGDFGVIRI